MDSNSLYAPPTTSPDSHKGIAVTVLILGIISDVMCLFCFWGAFFSIICSIVAIVLYLAFKKDIGSNVFKLANSGFICSIVSLILTALITVGIIAFYVLYMIAIFGITFIEVIGSIM